MACCGGSQGDRRFGRVWYMSVSDIFVSLFPPPLVLVCPCFGLTFSFLFFDSYLEEWSGWEFIIGYNLFYFGIFRENIHVVESLFLFYMGMCVYMFIYTVI